MMELLEITIGIVFDFIKLCAFRARFERPKECPSEYISKHTPRALYTTTSARRKEARRGAFEEAEHEDNLGWQQEKNMK